MRLYPQFKLLSIAVVLGIIILAAVFYFPLGRQKQWLYRFSNDSAHVTPLAVNQSVRQTLTLPAGTLSAIRFFTDNAILTGNTRVRILDASGQELAVAHGLIPSYLNGHLRVTTYIPWLVTTPAEHLQLEITRLAGEPLLIDTVSKDHYVSQSLTTNGQTTDQTMVVQLLRPATTTWGTKQGAFVAVFFTICLALIYTFVPKGSAYRWRWLTLLFIVVTPLCLLGFWFSADKLGINDWDYYFSLHHIWRETVLTFHQFPFWNPYTCGGTAALGDPEFSVLTPTFIWEFLLGVPTGLRLAIFTSIAITAAGMLKLARRLGLSWFAVTVVTLVGVFGSVNILEIVEGHVNIFAAMWIPWIFWSWLGAYRQARLVSRQTLLTSLFLSLTFYQGGIYLLLYTLLAFIVLPLLVRRHLHAVLVTATAGVIALGLSAIKLVPVILWLHQFPDRAYASAPFTISSTVAIFFGRYLHGASLVPDQVAGWHEYGAYIGVLAFALSLIGLTMWRKRPMVRALTIAAVLAWGLSTIGPLLQPFFDQMPYLPRSMISRVIFYSVIPLALLAGFGLDVVRHRWRGGQLLAFVMISLISFDLFSLTYQLSEQAFIVPQVPSNLAPAAKPIQFTGKVFYTTLTNGEKHISQYPVTLAGYGVLNYCSVLGPTSHITTIEDDVPKEYAMTRPPHVPVTVTSWTPNQVQLHVVASESTKVVINTNYAQGWVVSGGSSAGVQPAQEFENRVATTVPAGEHTLIFTYKPPGLAVGLTLTTLTGLSIGYFSLRKARATTKPTQTINTTLNDNTAG